MLPIKTLRLVYFLDFLFDEHLEIVTFQHQNFICLFRKGVFLHSGPVNMDNLGIQPLTMILCLDKLWN